MQIAREVNGCGSCFAPLGLSGFVSLVYGLEALNPKAQIRSDSFDWPYR